MFIYILLPLSPIHHLLAPQLFFRPQIPLLSPRILPGDRPRISAGPRLIVDEFLIVHRGGRFGLDVRSGLLVPLLDDEVAGNLVTRPERVVLRSSGYLSLLRVVEPNERLALPVHSQVSLLHQVVFLLHVHI